MKVETKIMHDMSYHVCFSDCEENCAQCSVLKECQKCNAPYLVQDGICVKSCTANYFQNKNKTMCSYNMEGPKIHFKHSINLIPETMSVINASYLQLFDVDTSRENLHIVIIETPENADMFLMNNRQIPKMLTKNNILHVSDFDEGKVLLNYINGTSFHSSLKVRVSDGQYESETESVAVNVVSLFSPEITIIEPLLVRIGGKAAITEDNLKIIDVDNPEYVTIKVLEGPFSGILTVKGKEALKFTIQELEELEVSYEFLSAKHNKRNKNLINSDQILFQAGDGYNYHIFLFHVVLVDSSKSTPIIIKNTGARVKEDGKIPISKNLLEAKAIDTLDENLIYSISHVHPTGNFVLVIPLPLIPNGFLNDGWIQMDEAHLSRPTSR